MIRSHGTGCHQTESTARGLLELLTSEASSSTGRSTSCRKESEQSLGVTTRPTSSPSCQERAGRESSRICLFYHWMASEATTSNLAAESRAVEGVQKPMNENPGDQQGTISASTRH